MKLQSLLKPWPLWTFLFILIAAAFMRSADLKMERAATVPSGRYSDDPPATMATYAAAFDDALGTFDNLGARAELPRLMHDLVHRGVEAGHGDDQLTALVKVLGEP